MTLGKGRVRKSIALASLFDALPLFTYSRRLVWARIPLGTGSAHQSDWETHEVLCLHNVMYFMYLNWSLPYLAL